VREQGVPLETFWVESSDGRKIGAYRFGNPDEVSRDKLGGRTVIPRSFKRRLLERHHDECCICLEQYDSRHLQVDHRVPYEVAGELEGQRRKIGDYMLLCGSCNRAKSWSCEQCKNWNALKSAGICQRCYWAYPEHYDHVAMRNIRRLDIVWTEEEADKFDEVKRDVEANGQSIQDYVKLLLLRHRHDD
jgi:hypothetical protein